MVAAGNDGGEGGVSGGGSVGGRAGGRGVDGGGCVGVVGSFSNAGGMGTRCDVIGVARGRVATDGKPET